MSKIKTVPVLLVLLIIILWGCEDTAKNSNPDESLIWEHIGFDGMTVMSIGFGSDSDIFIGTRSDQSSVYISSDDGELWDPILLTSSGVKSILVNSIGEIIVNAHSIYVSTDNGSTWERRDSPYGSLDVMSLTDEDVLFCGGWVPGYLAYRSHNNAESWENISAGLPPDHMSFHAIASDTFGNIFFGSVAVNNNPVGVFRYNQDQAIWAHAGLDTLSVNTLMTSLSGVIFAGTSHGLYRSLDNANTWEKAGLVGQSIEVLESDEFGNLFAGVFNGDGVFVSNDNGDTWDQVISGLGTSIGVWALEIDSENRIYLGTSSHGLYRGVYTP